MEICLQLYRDEFTSQTTTNCISNICYNHGHGF